MTAPRTSPCRVSTLRAGLGIPQVVFDAGAGAPIDDVDPQLLGINGKDGDFAGIEYAYIDPQTGCRGTSQGSTATTCPQ